MLVVEMRYIMTLEEIAKELGVSKSTVSRALSGKGRIGEETRNKIYSYAKECGYATKKEIRLKQKILV